MAVRRIGCAEGPRSAARSEAANPFAPTGDDGDTNPQTLSVAFGVCFKDPRVDNISDDPKTKFDETQVYNYLPKYMKLVCNVDGSVSKLTFNDERCMTAEVNDVQVTSDLLQAMLSAEAPGTYLSQLPTGAVEIKSPADNLVTGTCYEEFRLDLHTVIPSLDKPLALSTKYTSLGQCAPAIAGAGWVRSTDFDNADCSKPDAPTANGNEGGNSQGAAGDSSNKVAVQFGVCYMDPDFQNLVDGTYCRQSSFRTRLHLTEPAVQTLTLHLTRPLLATTCRHMPRSSATRTAASLSSSTSTRTAEERRQTRVPRSES